MLLGAGIFLLALLTAFNTSQVLSIEQIAEKTSQKISDNHARCLSASQHLLATYPEVEDNVKGIFETEQIAFYLYRNDSLLYWNNAQVSVQEPPAFFKKNQGLIKLRYGYFVYTKTTKENLTALAICLVKPTYALQNNYLSNDFSAWLGIPKDIDIDTTFTAKAKVYLNKELLFGLKGNEQGYYQQNTDNLCSLFFYVGCLLVLISLLLLMRLGITSSVFFTTLGLSLLARALMLFLHWPDFLYRSMMYDPHLFGNAQSVVNGFLGDIVLNACFFLFVSSGLHFFLRQRVKPNTYLTLPLMACWLFFLVNQFNKIIISLVNNSTFDFNFLNIVSVKPGVFIGLSALGILALAVFVVLNTLIYTVKQINRAPLWFYVSLLLICVVQQVVSNSLNAAENFWLLPASLVVYAAGSLGQNGKALALGLYTLVLSVVTSGFLNSYINKNSLLDQQVLVQKLEERQDEILESEFAALPQKIQSDENLNNLLNLLPESENEVEQKLKQHYFNSYFDRYDIHLSLFDKNCNPFLKNTDGVLMNEGFFDDRMNYLSLPVSEYLFFVKDYLKNTQYLAKIPLGNFKLFVLMEAKQFEEVGSFPDLFLDQSLQKQDKLKSFSFAVYRSGQNTSRYGDFNYPYFYKDSVDLSRSAPGFTHSYYQPDPTTNIIISRQVRSRGYFFTFNSYLLLLFSLLTYCCYLVYAFVFTSQFSTSSLTRRIQTIIIVLLLLAMSAVGITSGNLVTGQFEAENKKQLEEKTQVIVSELNSRFKPGQLFDESLKELLNTQLREYSRLFNTPISLYTKSGNLFNTSEPKLYDFGLAAPLANPAAFETLNHNLTSAVIIREKAGKLNYLSLYTPLFNEKKELIGFMNLPYFARVSDLANDLSQIISALINVYVILFVLSIVAGLILSGYITQPLRLIKQQLSKITLGTKNEKITWQSNDEIGKLVAEYNLMLLKLEESANLLAKSERESAWREMAKQVAHEIKNPLTPMKLNLQYLQHLMKNNPEDFKERFEKASSGIIEQIDALATIATEFSNFAKLPMASLQTIHLDELISSAVHVFENQKGVRILNSYNLSELPVMGDKEQCLRVFNNLFKNAVQALEGIENACIMINGEVSGSRVVVSVSDNGCGIDEDLKAKIFSPNFTTKTTGSGLGLAMVKNIMEGFGGSIRFESEKGKGTTFRLEFIAATNPAS